LAEPGDLDETARNIVHLLRDPDLRRRLGSAAARDVRRRFDETAVVRRLRTVYASLLTAEGYALAPQSTLLGHEPSEKRHVLASA
jgi:hypothetical protein